MRSNGGMMVDGVADFEPLREAIEVAGDNGPSEVDSLSAKDRWKRPSHKVLEAIVERFRTACLAAGETLI